MLHPKQINYTSLTVDQRRMAVQRLTALWAFCESGLGGILHAFQFPFTGLFIGGFAVIIITLITKFSAQSPYQVFQSLVVVLAIKAMVSPYSPVTAYLAVSFQGLMGFVFYRLLHVNVVSIVLVSVITMLESAVQKLLVLTFFFGQSFWKAVDDITDFITNQMGVSAVNGSRWVIALYLSVYFTGGILVALMTCKISKSFSSEIVAVDWVMNNTLNQNISLPVTPKRKNSRKKLYLMIGFMLILSALLFVFASDAKRGWVGVLKTVCWTSSAILIWYLLITPLFTRFVLRILQKKENRYSANISGTLSIIPALRPLTAMAWNKSKMYTGWNRIYFFLFALVRWSLVYSDDPGLPNKNPSMESTFKTPQ